MAEARDQLSRLVAEAHSFHERIELTRNGKRAAVILGADDYDALTETLAVLSNSELVAHIREALAELDAGGGHDQAELTARLRKAGKFPHA